MKNKYIIGLIIICITSITVFILKNKHSYTTDDKQEIVQEEKQENIISDASEGNIDDSEKNKLEEIKEDLGYSNSDSQIYEIKKEYDGREVITIKPNIQYKVAMAGAIKKGKPEFKEIDKIMEQAPNKSGIWITNSSRDKVLRALKEVTNGKYLIDENGYLIQENFDENNEVDVKIKQIFKEKKLYAIDIETITYIVDEVTGNIEEYPFVEIDPKTPYEIFKTENATLYVINPNINKKLNEIDMIKEIITSIDI